MNRDWVDKDFYSVLGVAKEASPEEIKRAYRKLAQKHHPDANPGDPAAEDRFKDVSEAHATLSDPEQRKEYDEVRRLVESGGYRGFGSGGAGGFGGFGGQQVRVEDLGNLFGGLGDLFGTRRTSAARKGADLAAELELDFEEAVGGITTTVSVRGEGACSRCGGSGAEPGTAVTTCPTCRGSGTVAQNQGFFSFAQPCPECGGSGRLISTRCSQCRGRGVEVRDRTIKVKVPMGVANGSTIRVPGKGSPGGVGAPAGDLIVKVRVRPHRLFTRKGNDLLVNLPISFSEAALGTKVEVPTLDDKVTVRIPAGTPSGKTFRVRNRGITDGRRTGDLLAKVEVFVPSKLTKEERKLLEELATHQTEDLRSHLNVGASG